MSSPDMAASSTGSTACFGAAALAWLIAGLGLGGGAAWCCPGEVVALSQGAS